MRSSVRVRLAPLFVSFVAALSLAQPEGPTSATGLSRQQAAAVSFTRVTIDASTVDRWTKIIADIDGDGFNDIITAGCCGELSWYRYPDWTWADIGGGFVTVDGEAGDVDGDGDLDIVMGGVSWFENPRPTGDPSAGNWSQHPISGGSVGTHDVSVADLDGDGDLDVVTRDQGGGGATIKVWRQNSPTSWTVRDITAPAGEGLHLGDIDRDGDQDVIIGGRWYENTGNLVSGPWTEYTFTDSWPSDAVVGELAGPDSAGLMDINGDGFPDVVLTRSEGPHKLSWFQAPSNPKTGAWTEHVVDDPVDNGHGVGLADLDRDGDWDIATAEMHQSSQDRVLVYLNGGAGAQWTRQVLSTEGSHNLQVGDIGNDGDIDLVGGNWSDGAGPVRLWRNDSKMSLDAWQRHVVDPDRLSYAVFVTSADLDGDGKKDIVAGGGWYKNPGSAGGSWTRTAISDDPNNDPFNMAAVYDFDSDGKPDILGTRAFLTGSDFAWAHNLGSGAFEILTNIASGDGDFLQGVAVDRFSPGGPLEVALSWHAGGLGVQMLTVPANPLSSVWAWQTITSFSQDEQLSSGDIDRDGDRDLLLGTAWLRNDGSTWTEFDLSDAGGSPDRNRLADINADGRLDAVVGFEAPNTQGKLAWYEQPNPATSLWTEHVIATIIGPMSLDVADMDQDGDLDVIAGEHYPDDPASARLYVFENLDGRGGAWQAHVAYTGDEHHDGAQVVDIDNDGDLDILSIGWNHSDVLLYENKGQVSGRSGVCTTGCYYLPLILKQSAGALSSTTRFKSRCSWR